MLNEFCKMKSQLSDIILKLLIRIGMKNETSLQKTHYGKYRTGSRHYF